jgi:hypothetical protein
VERPADTPFSLEEERTFTAAVPYEVADLPGLAASYSRVMVLPAAERRALREEVAARAAARPELAARHDGRSAAAVPGLAGCPGLGHPSPQLARGSRRQLNGRLVGTTVLVDPAHGHLLSGVELVHDVPETGRRGDGMAAHRCDRVT